MEKSSIGCPVLLGCKSYPGQLEHNASEGYDSRLSVDDQSDRRDSNDNPWSMQESLTVSVTNVCKAYEKDKPVLSNLCMKVRTGTIYGLLGSSGCGKTTALSCIVGLKKWDSGQVYLFGRKPHGAPGKRVGFMPQDVALYDEISIKESIEYYGRLYGMRKEEVEKQWLWLVDFLQLPSKFKLVKDCSGGQKRRVSLAVTLAHSPDLLILDEPTVGLDPLLRESIWQYLFNIVSTKKTTVIVTTHYIEEARCSNTIGVMRKGRLLVEDSPETLLKLYESDLLEQVVLKLCRTDEKSLRRSGSDNGSNASNNNVTEVVVADKHLKAGNKKSSKNSYNVFEKFQENWQLSSQRRSSIRMLHWNGQQEGSDSSVFQRIRALSTVIWLMFMRHPAFMTMVLLLPTLQLILTLAVLGTHPKDLKFGVVNLDTPDYDSCFLKNGGNGNTVFEDALQVDGNSTSTCHNKNLSCRLISEMSRTSTLNLIPIQSDALAREEVVKGNMWGYFYIPSNYSLSLTDLAVSRKFAENETLEGSRVHVTMDMSHYLVGLMVLQESYVSYENFAKSVAGSCGLDPREFQLPMMYRKPVFGENDGTFADYVIPIVVISVVVEVPMLVTSILFISDRRQGTLDRGRVAGMRIMEVMISHLLTQGSVIIGQTAICSAVMHFFYNFRVAGSYWQYFLVGVLGGLFGEAGGLLLGVVAHEEVEAVIGVMFIGSILLLYEGTLGPLQGFNPIAKYIAYCFPTTLNVESLRSIIYRGVNFFHLLVYPGVSILVAWTIFLWIMSAVVFIRKQR